MALIAFLHDLPGSHAIISTLIELDGFEIDRMVNDQVNVVVLPSDGTFAGRTDLVNELSVDKQMRTDLMTQLGFYVDTPDLASMEGEDIFNMSGTEFTVNGNALCKEDICSPINTLYSGEDGLILSVTSFFQLI